MNSSIKLLVLDIDGTIVGNDYFLNPHIISVIKKVKRETDIKLLLASGRMTYSTQIIAEQLEIDTPLIVYQGAMVNDVKNNQILFHKTLDPVAGLEIIQDIENEDIHINVYIEDKLYMKELNEMAKTYTSYRSVVPNMINDFEFILDNPPTKILGLDDNTEKIHNLIENLQKKYLGRLNIFGSNPIFIEIINPEVNKGITLVEVAKNLWDIKPENIMAIGDGNNDYYMIKSVGYGVAMGNATEKIKSAAKYHTYSVNQNGAAYAIEQLIFQGADKVL